MPKLLWVGLPLLVAAALVGALALRGRPLSRRALNAWSSVLLLSYVLATAGLGIFWVANQQLPVFDWHYLFGYATLLLVALHLGFNFRIAWQYFTRPRAARPRTARVMTAGSSGGAAPGRRGALGALGVVAATGTAFALGLRHGRSELRVESAPGRAGGDAPADLATSGLALVERFHAFSSHSRSGVLLRPPGLEWQGPPPLFKRYPEAPRLALPVRRVEPGAGFDALAALAATLWHTTGVTERRGGLELRAAPSSGALFSTELYVVAARALPGLAPGLWHYDPQTHALERLRQTAPGDAALGAPGEPALRDAAAVVVATAVFRRTGHKYRDRTYRYVLADLGHALENLRLAATAAGLQARLVAAFDESLAAAALEVDQVEEGVLAMVALEPASQAGAVAASSWPLRPAAPRRPAPGSGAPPAASPQSVTALVHAATSLALAVPSPAPAASATPPTPTPTPATVLPPGAIVLPAAATAAPPQVDMLAVIAARRSRRRFAGTPLTAQALGGALGATLAPGGPILSTAIRVDVIVHAVGGIAPGAYRYASAAHALVPSRVEANLRDASRAAALDQDVIGSAAAVFVLSIDRAAFAADPLGPARGYRHAFLEAGLVGERIYLYAAQHGLGVCGVGAFYDDEASRLVGVDPAREWVVHFAALGVVAG